MAQKYKFFIKDKVVIFSQAADFGINDKDLELEWIEHFKSFQINASTEVYWPDLEMVMAALKGSITHIIAGGGVVLNERNALLMIHRRGFWDLPKGKQEPDEPIALTAVREVEEECGINGLKVRQVSPVTTYHFYRENDEAILKESVWFLMDVDGVPSLTPQIAEDIIAAEWVPVPISADIMKSSYESIIEVLRTFNLSE